jgi:hypothetical protein
LLLNEGYIPLGGFGGLYNGIKRFDLLLTNREDLAAVVVLLKRFGSVRFDSVSQ